MGPLGPPFRPTCGAAAGLPALVFGGPLSSRAGAPALDSIRAVPLPAARGRDAAAFRTAWESGQLGQPGQPGEPGQLACRAATAGAFPAAVAGPATAAGQRSVEQARTAGTRSRARPRPRPRARARERRAGSRSLLIGTSRRPAVADCDGGLIGFWNDRVAQQDLGNLFNDQGGRS